MSEDEQAEKILKVLQNADGELYTKQVAQLAGLSNNTAAKYLSVLHSQGKILLRKQIPFKFWRAKEKTKKGET